MSVPKTLVLLLAFSAVIAGCSQTEVVDVEAESAAIRELGRQVELSSIGAAPPPSSLFILSYCCRGYPVSQDVPPAPESIQPQTNLTFAMAGLT